MLCETYRPLYIATNRHRSDPIACGTQKVGLPRSHARIELASRASFISSLDDPKHLGWYTSVADEFASLWLNVSPKSYDFTFSTSTFRSQLCTRMYLPQPELPSGLVCDCIVNKAHPVIDSRCHHIITGCNKNGSGINLHHALSNVLKEMAGTLGIRAKREEACFNNVQDGTHSAKKCDVSFFDMPGPGPTKHVLDVSSIFVVPIFGVAANRSYTRAKALVPQRQAELRYAEKMRIYDNLATQNNLKFQPIIFETSGRMHSLSLSYIKSILKDHNILDGHALSHYWLRRLSCCYQRAVSMSILEKLRKQKGAGITGLRYENRAEFISSILYQRT